MCGVEWVDEGVRYLHGLLAKMWFCVYFMNSRNIRSKVKSFAFRILVRV